MMSSRIVQLLFLVSSMTFQLIGMVTQGISPKPPKRVSSLPFKVEGIAQKIAALSKELQYNIFSSALALRETPKYEVYRKLDVGSEVRGIALNADNTRAFTKSNDGLARIWNVENGTILKKLEDHTGRITSVALSADGTRALTGSSDRTTCVWNALTGEPLRVLEADSFVSSVALSSDGTLALIGGFGIARLYNTSTGELIKVLEGHEKNSSLVALSADGTLAFTSSFLNSTAQVWNIPTGESIILQVGAPISSVALSADGTIALTGTDDDKVLVWNTKVGTLLNTLLTTGQVNSVALSKDGKRALAGISDNTIQVWNTKPLPGQKETSTPLTVLEGHTGPVRTVTFGGADFIASGSYDGTALIWKPFALKPQGPQENVQVLRQVYKETFARAILRSTNGD